MNYIKQLQQENLELKQLLNQISDEMLDIDTYLGSAKFHNDTTVQVGDIVNRTRQIRLLSHI